MGLARQHKTDGEASEGDIMRGSTRGSMRSSGAAEEMHALAAAR